MLAVGFSPRKAESSEPRRGATFESAPAAQLIVQASLRDACPLPQPIRGSKPVKTHGYHHVVALRQRRAGRLPYLSVHGEPSFAFCACIGTMNRQRKGARTALSASPGSSVRADMAVRAPGNGSWKEVPILWAPRRTLSLAPLPTRSSRGEKKILGGSNKMRSSRRPRPKSTNGAGNSLRLAIWLVVAPNEWPPDARPCGGLPPIG